MSALTTPQAVPHIIKRTLFAKIAAGEKIFVGAKCGFKAGYLYAWQVDADLKHPCVAIRDGKPIVDNVYDNTDGDDGDITCPVDFVKEKTLFFYDNDAVAPVVQANIGGDCYGIDDHTVSADDDTNARARAGTPWMITTGTMGNQAGVYVEV